MNRATELFLQFESEGLMDDRREYSVEDLVSAYKLTEQDAGQLFSAVQGMYVPRNIKAEDLKEYMDESEHGGWEGYTTEQVMTIYQFLYDVSLYVQNK